MADSAFQHGDPLMVDHTPGSAVALGEVIVVGDRAFVAHNAIAASEKSAVAAGGGVYQFTADAAIAAGKTVYWDNTAKKVTETSAGNTKIGTLTPDSSSAADGDSVNVIHSLAV